MLKLWFFFANSIFFRTFASRNNNKTFKDYGKDNYNKRKTSL